jgi:16S rRNA (adenine1518-N6/adenine1519-N6)-dimethyltransferase
VIEAKKKFGQNFLQDLNIKHKIIQSMPKTERQLVEIGPGLGDLTQKLLEVKPLIAYEVDSDLCVYLRDKFSKDIACGRLVLNEGDVLEKFKKDSLCDREYDLVANLPYYIATTIILKALQDPLCKCLIVMIQKEVALKFAATCKTKEFTSLAILASIIGSVEVLFDVPPSAFEPQPKVFSSVIKIEKHKEYFGKESTGVFNSKAEFEAFEKYLRVAFQAPRKTWIKNISSNFSKEKALSLLSEQNLSDTIRPHELSVLNHHLLFKKLQEKSDGRKTTRDSEKD